MSALDTRAYWDDLVTCAMLGADRREPPHAPPGPFADLALDDPRPAPAERLAQQIAAVAVARRAGMRPAAAPRHGRAGPEIDERPATPPIASHRWRAVVARFAVLEDEWLVAVLAFGWRLSPELAPPLLRRHRTHPVRAARVRAACGPLAAWLVEQMPDLAPSAAARVRVPAEALTTLPDLPIPPDLLALTRGDDDAPGADEVVAALCEPVRHGRVPAAHLRALANVVARVPRSVLPAIAEALESHPLGDMARMRAAMIADLTPPTPAEDP